MKIKPMSNPKQPPILHLNLTKKWFDMIESGEKKEEYREMKPYWHRIFQNGKIKIKGKYYHPTDVVVCFSNGYARDRPQMKFTLNGLSYRGGFERWGAVRGVQYFVLRLGKKL